MVQASVGAPAENAEASLIKSETAAKIRRTTQTDFIVLVTAARPAEFALLI